jgi:rubrerythrin
MLSLIIKGDNMRVINKKQLDEREVLSDILENSPYIIEGMNYYYEELLPQNIDKNTWGGTEEIKHFYQYSNQINTKDMQKLLDLVEIVTQKANNLAAYNQKFIREVKGNVLLGFYDKDKKAFLSDRWRLYMIVLDLY